MKTISLVSSTVAATLFLLTSVFAAENAAPKKPERSKADRAQAMKNPAENPKIIERFDVDGDGQLNEAEKATAREEMKKRGGNMREKFAGQREEVLKRHDKNGDGKLDDAERTEAQKEMRANIDQFPALKQRLDTDKDGKVSDAEWEAGREKLPHHQHQRGSKK